VITKDYTASQLKAFLRPAQVQTEFGLDKGNLEYLRGCSIDEGKLRGPMFLKDGNCILYQRASVVKWLKQTMFQEAETDETTETIKTKKTSVK
tara:strand:- start:55 stop:333 length:279 start_codon:yes stop_codon:yes gene_type:complete